MNEKELQELYKSLSVNPRFQLGTLDEFRAMILDPQAREQFREAMNKQPGIQLGTKDEFEDYLGLKKKVSSPVSEPSSSIPQPVRIVGEGSNRLQLDWGTGQIKRVPVVSPDVIQQTTQQVLEDTADVTVKDVQDKPLQSKGERALESIRKRRLGTMDYESPATKFTDIIEDAKNEPKSPAEAAMPTFESVMGKKNPFFPDQAGYKELSALVTAISNENAEINAAVDYLDAKLKSEAGFSLSDYYTEIGKFNAIQKSIETEIQKSRLPEYEAKLNKVKGHLESPDFVRNEEFLNTYNSVIQEYNDLVEQNTSTEQVSALQARIKGLQEQPEFKNINAFISNRQEIIKEYQSIANKYNSEATLLNEKISIAQQQSDEIMQRIEEMDSNPDLSEIKRLQGLYNINVEKFKAEIKSGRYEYAQQFGEYLDWMQQQIDERYKNLSGFQKAMANTGRIALQSLVKIPRDIARLSDVIEKSVGIEGEKKGIGDKIQDFYIDLGNDMLNELREPTKLQRGGFTDTAQWGDLQVDFSSDGEIISVRDKDGYVVPQMLSKEQEEEIKALPRENKFHASSFAYQTSQTLVDIAVQILGTKGLSNLKVIPGITVSRWGGVGLTAKPLSTGVSLAIVNAGMMADDLYMEGIRNGLSKENAARYSLITGLAIGALNAVMGIGAEASFLRVGKFKLPEPDFGKGLSGAIGKRLFNFSRGGIGESFEEVVLERSVTALSQYAMNNLAGGNFDIGALARDTNEIKNELAISFIAGGIVDSFKNKKKPSEITTSVMIDGSKDIPAIITAVEDVAEAAGLPLSPAEVVQIKSELEVVAKAVELAPQEHKSNPDVISIVAEKVKIDDQISTLKEEIKGTDDSFNQEKKDQIAELEKKSAELSIKASEAAGVKPDEKALKNVSVQEGVAGEGAASPSTDVQQSETITKSESEFETTNEQSATSEIKKEEATPQEPTVETTLVDPALVEDISLEGVSEGQVSEKILQEGSPIQVGKAWMAEADIIDPLDPANPDFKSLIIRDAIRNIKFSRKSLSRKYGGKDLNRVNQRYGTRTGRGVDAREEAERLTDYFQIGEITEEDIFDAIDANIANGVPDVTRKTNKTKKALAARFKELTGQNPTPELVAEMEARRATVKEEAAITEQYDTALPDARRRPKRISGDRVYKALLKRVTEDETIDDETRSEVKNFGLTRESLKNEYVNELADYEIDGAVEFFGFEEGLKAVTDDAFELLTAGINAQRPGTPQDVRQKAEVNAALASMVLQKVAYTYSINGQKEAAAAIYDSLQGLSQSGGQFIQALSEQATPEAVANRVTAEIYSEQRKKLKQMGARGKTMMQLIENLTEQIKASKEEVRTAMKASNAVSAAKQQIANKKAQIKQKRSEIISSLKEKWNNLQNLGVAFDPEQEAKQQIELIKDIAALIKTYVDEGVTNVQDLFNAAVEALIGIGIAQNDAERFTKDALLRESDIETKDVPKGKQTPLMDVPLRGTVGKDQIEALEFGEPKKGKQGKILDVPLRGTVPGAADVEIGTLPTGEQSTIEGDIDAIIDRFLKGENEKSLWAELVDAGVNEKVARQIEKETIKAIGDVQSKKIAQAVTKLKEEMKANNFKGREKKWKDTEKRIIAAAKSGIIDNDAMVVAFGTYLAYPAMTAADTKRLAELGKKIYDAIAKESKARLRRELDLFMDEMDAKNGFTAAVLAKEFQSLVIMGALSSFGTSVNVIIGSIAGLLPKIGVMMAQNPVGTIAAVKAFRAAKSKNAAIGRQELLNSVVDNVSVTELYGNARAEKFGRKASLVEDAILTGLGRYYNKMTKGMQEGDKKNAAIGAAQLLATVIFQPLRIAFALPGIDSVFSQPLSEYVRFIEAYNKVAKDMGLAGISNIRERLGDSFINKVSKYGHFDAQSWEAARIQAEQDMAIEEAMGIKHTKGFVERRAKEIIHEQVKESEVSSAMRFVREGLLMGHPAGYLTGGFYNFMSRALGVGDTKDPLGAWAKAFVNTAIGLFLRVSANGVNMIYNSMPLLIPTAANGIISRIATGETMWAKKVGTQEAKNYPKSQQLEAEGWVRKSNTEIAQQIGLQTVSTLLLMLFISDMFDRDDEGNVILDPDRHFDISLGQWGGYREGQEKIDMKPNSVRFRWDTSKDWEESTNYSFSLLLPFFASFAIAAGMRDDLIYRPDVFRERGYFSKSSKNIFDVFSATSEVSFSTIPRFLKDLVRTGQRATSVSESGGSGLAEWGKTGAKVFMRPIKTAMQPSFYRDIYVSWQDYMKNPVKQPENIAEEFAKDMIFLDWMVRGVKKDEYGNVIRQESRFRNITENILLNFVDIKGANEDIFEQPEWRLRRKHPAVKSAGYYIPDKNLKNVDGKKLTEDELLKLADDFLNINGRETRKFYEELNQLESDESFKKGLDAVRNYAIDLAKYENNVIDEEPSEDSIYKYLDNLLENTKD